MAAYHPRMGPLRGLRVVDMTRMVPGAFCTLLLADLGADVVKVETPGSGDGLRGLGKGRIADASHLALNRGKRSVAIDLGAPSADAVLKRAVDWADVVVESHRPGQLDRRGLGYKAMRVGHPQLVWCAITGFGDEGPNADLGGHDLTYLGYSGLLSRLSDSPPTPPRTTLSLPLAALTAAVGILAAVAEMRKTGEGRKVEVNMTDSAMWLLSEEIARTANQPGPGWGASAGRNVYACADGRSVTVAANGKAAWERLCEAVGVDAGGEEPSVESLAELFRTQPAAHWLSYPGPSGGVGPVNEVADLLEDPHVHARGSLVTLPDSGARVLASPVRFDGANGAEATCAATDPPDLGAHTDEFLVALGLSRSDIEQLRAAGIIG